MEENQILDGTAIVDGNASQLSRVFTAHVFSWMVAGLAITAVVAWLFASSGAVFSLFTENGRSLLGWVVMLAPLGFILVMNLAFEKLSATALSLIFLAFSAVMGMSLSYIFFVYSMTAIIKVFGITSATFAIMAVVGYTTKTDLTKFGSLLMMAVIGIVLASLVNMFLGSERLDYIISIVGVLVFTGLIAYDTQKIRLLGMQVGLGSQQSRKLALMGATSLYLDFINLFLFLLRILGRRD
ncbi:MAG: hypothetical protein RL226_472 [Bacteroidota bacterium]